MATPLAVVRSWVEQAVFMMMAKFEYADEAALIDEDAGQATA